jgi:hypothetical protein
MSLSIYHWTIYHFQAILNWWDGLFKACCYAACILPGGKWKYFSFTDVVHCRQSPDANLSPRIHFRMQICPDVHIKTCPSPMWTCPLADMVQCRRADKPPCTCFLMQTCPDWCRRICPPCGHFQLQNDPVQTCRHVLTQTCPFADMPQRTLPVWKWPLWA